MVNALKAFKTYVLQSQIIAYVPNAATKDVLLQGDVEGRRGRWIAKIQEYDLDIKPTKLVKGQGLAKMLTENQTFRHWELTCWHLGMKKQLKKVKESKIQV